MELSIMKYNMFLVEEMRQQAEFEALVNESILISTNEVTLDSMSILHESTSDKLKSSLGRFVKFLKTIWEKFTESVNTLVKNNKDYLDKYKDIILTKKLRETDEYSMYSYSQGIKNIVNSPVPTFSYETLKDKLTDKETFINGTDISKYKLDKGEENLIDTLKSYFRGSAGEGWIKATQLNMTDIFNYCYNYDNMKDKIEKDQKNIISALDEATKLIDRVGKSPSSNTTPDTSESAKTESYYFNNTKEETYSYVYETYITEEDVEEKSKQKQKAFKTKKAEAQVKIDKEKEGSGIGGGVQVKTAAASIKNTDGKGEKMSEDDVKGGNEEAEVMTKKVNVYCDVCKDVLATKLTISEEVYKAYFAIIKAHVRNNLGKKSEDDKKSKDTATNYDADLKALKNQ